MAHLTSHSHRTLQEVVGRIRGITASLYAQFPVPQDVSGDGHGAGDADRGEGGEGRHTSGDGLRDVVSALDALARAVGAVIGSVQAQAEGDWALEVRGLGSGMEKGVAGTLGLEHTHTRV